MAEAKQYVVKFTELAEILVRQENIREGHWGVFVKFGLNATNVQTSPNEMLPAAIVPVIELGIQRFDEPNPLTVDAAKVHAASGKK